MSSVQKYSRTFKRRVLASVAVFLGAVVGLGYSVMSGFGGVQKVVALQNESITNAISEGLQVVVPVAHADTPHDDDPWEGCTSPRDNPPDSESDPEPTGPACTGCGLY